MEHCVAHGNHWRNRAARPGKERSATKAGDLRISCDDIGKKPVDALQNYAGPLQAQNTRANDAEPGMHNASCDTNARPLRDFQKCREAQDRH
ncbi:MAG: hypothetical protein OXI87_13600 [Albidovulum sp.]|nr:hypothetical protein [Albidovulum sp.]MDE0530590.1 hypothetical protein [Albidovulum sp.]